MRKNDFMENSAPLCIYNFSLLSLVQHSYSIGKKAFTCEFCEKHFNQQSTFKNISQVFILEKILYVSGKAFLQRKIPLSFDLRHIMKIVHLRYHLQGKFQ